MDPGRAALALPHDGPDASSLASANITPTFAADLSPQPIITANAFHSGLSAFELLPVHDLVKPCLETSDKLNLATSSQRLLQLHRCNSRSLTLKVKPARPMADNGETIRRTGIADLKPITSDAQLCRRPDRNRLFELKRRLKELKQSKTILPEEAAALLSLLSKQKRLAQLKALSRFSTDVISQALRKGFLSHLRSLSTYSSDTLLQAMAEGHAKELTELRIVDAREDQDLMMSSLGIRKVVLDLGGLPCLRDLSLYDFHGMAFDESSAWPSSLSKLTLINCASEAFVQQLENGARDQLQYLNLKGVTNSSKVGSIFTSGPWPRLETLEAMTIDMTQAIAEGIKLHHFQNLLVLKCDFAPSLMEALAVEGAVPRLRHLQLKPEEMPSCHHVAKAIHLYASPLPPLLQHLELHWLDVDFFQTYALPKTLTTLILRNCDLQGSFTKLISILGTGGGHELESLTLTACGVGEQDIRALAAMLGAGGWRSLRYLGLDHNVGEDDKGHRSRLFSREAERALMEALMASSRKGQVAVDVNVSMMENVEIPEGPRHV